MPDPRINCAAEICCPPPAAREAKKKLVTELLGGSEILDSDTQRNVDTVMRKMAELDIEFAPGELMRAIRNLADHPNSKVKEKDKKGVGNISVEEAEGFDLNSAE